MNITKYRQHVVNFPYVQKRRNWRQPWEQVRVFVPPHLRLRLSDNYISTYNHPLVNSGEAYWSNNTTLCIGYRLRNNPDIFRPIFNYNRQRNIDQFHIK